MVAIIKTLLATGVFVAQLSSAAAFNRDERANHHKSKTTVTPTSSTSTVSPTAVTAIAGASSATSLIASAAGAGSTASYWKPVAGTTWQIELSDVVSDFTYAADVFDVDLFDTPTSTINTLHGNGKKVICYFSAGTYEDWRSDASSFTSADKGSTVDGWAGEWWLQTKSTNVRNIMTARIQLALTKGCDGVDPDNVDGYNNSNGLGLTKADAIDYLTFLAAAAHTRGLAIGLKNAGEIVEDVLSIMEWQVNEQCEEYTECDTFRPFIDAGKPVFHIEYPDSAPDVDASVIKQICGDATAAGFSTVLKDMDLDAWIYAC